MWVLPKGNTPTKQEYAELLARIEDLERKVALLQPKRSTPKTEVK